MPKNQFQRPLPVRHDGKVPRHGKTQPPISRIAAKPAIKAPSSALPPLEALLEKATGK